jgi:hypothetical protein
MSGALRRARPLRARLADLGLLLVLVAALPGLAAARSSVDWDPSQLKSRVTKFALPNGMRFLVMERRQSGVQLHDSSTPVR